ncbi:MAG: hypothetical protein EOP86_21840 [Verrucomicrobiaceae bacterium]|nr:MAG: hypothetical protein EOP86_21840 [Verrucomicrobiaceae bacterium]
MNSLPSFSELSSLIALQGGVSPWLVLGLFPALVLLAVLKIPGFAQSRFLPHIGYALGAWLVLIGFNEWLMTWRNPPDKSMSGFLSLLRYLSLGIAFRAFIFALVSSPRREP